MIYRNNDYAVLAAMERGRTGNYGEDSYDYTERTVYCCECGCDIRDTRTEKAFSYGDAPLCEDCFREALFDEFADECGTPVDEWED